MNIRKVAYTIIYKTISDTSYTNLLMRSMLNDVDKINRPFITNLVNGVLKNYDYLLFQVKDDINEKTPLKNKVILTMALYERYFLNEKDYVVNNEYVELCDNKYDKSFINAILRKTLELKEPNDEYIKFSLPKWLYDLLYKQYNKDDFNKIIKNYFRVPKVYYRINKKKFDLNKKDFDFINDEIFSSKDNLIESDLFKNGLIYIQDLNSANLIKNLKLNENDVILDVCSAPGSKLFNCLDIINDANAYANDLHEKRINLIKDKAAILGFNNIHYLCGDGRQLKDKLNIKFNKIILDAPCSGLGTIGRKPDLKFHILPSSLDELQVIQKELLDSVKDLLLDGGELLYCTCTLNKKENNKQVEKFLSKNDNFRLIKDETIINELGDCFYYAVLGKC